MEFSYPFKVQKAIKKDIITGENKVDSKISSEELNKNNLSGATGFFPFGVNSFWHGGIHLNEIKSELEITKELINEPVRAIADGKVIAYRIMENSKDGNKVLNSNSFVLIKHNYKSPNGLNFVFYSLYMHLLPWDIYKKEKKTLIVPGFFKRPKFIVDSTKDGDGLNLRGLDNWKNIKTVIPYGVAVSKIGESPDKKWRNKEDYPKSRKTGKPVKSWKPDGYKKFSYVDSNGNEYKGYAYIHQMRKTSDGRYRVITKGDKQKDINKKGIKVFNPKNEKEVYTVLLKGTQIYFKNPDEAILAFRYNTKKNLSLNEYEGYVEKGNVKVSKDTFKKDKDDIPFDDIPFEFDKIVNIDLNNKDYDIKAGEVVGYCGSYYGEKTVHIEVFASEKEKIGDEEVKNNFTSFFKNTKNDNLMKKEWDNNYEFGKKSVFYHRIPKAPSGSYSKGDVLKVVKKRGEFPYSNTIKVRKIAHVNTKKTYFAGSNPYVPGTNNHQVSVNSGNTLYQNTIPKEEEVTRSKIRKCPSATKKKTVILRRETKLLISKNRWVMGFDGGYFKGYIQTNLNSPEQEFYVDCEELDAAGYECNRSKTEYLIKDNLIRYSKNPEILFSENESELLKQKTSPIPQDKKVTGKEIKGYSNHTQGNTVWRKLNLKIDKKDAWFKEDDLINSKINYHNHEEFFHLVKLPDNDQLINNICESPKLIHEVEKSILDKLKSKKKNLESSNIEIDKKRLSSLNAQISDQEKKLKIIEKKLKDSFLNDSKTLKEKAKKDKKNLKTCIACCPTEWSNKLYEKKKLEILKKHWNYTDTDLKTLIKELKTFEFWETVSATGHIPKDGENLMFFHPIEFIDHMNKLKFGYSDEFKLFVATVYGEATYCTNVAWKAIAHVVMNRVGGKYWKTRKTVTDVIRKTGFDACTKDIHGNYMYQKAVGYLNGKKEVTVTCKVKVNGIKVFKTWTDPVYKHEKETIKSIITNIIGIYLKREDDFTQGANFYYSPWALNYLHEHNPSDYSSSVPPWVRDCTLSTFKNGFKLDRKNDYVNNKSRDDFEFYIGK